MRYIFSSLIGLILLAYSAQAYAQQEIRSATAPCSNGQSYPVHLTFDDGPAIPQTLQILDILKRNNIKATFFLSFDKFPNLAKGKSPSKREVELMKVVDRIKSEGHTVGSHSYSHIDHAVPTNQSQILANLEASFRVADRLGLPAGSPFRFPYGAGWLPESKSGRRDMGRIAMRKIKERGYQPLHWDIDTEDWSKTKRKALPYSLLSQTCGSRGGVVLLHDIHPWTVNNLTPMIHSLRDSGHRFVSYQEILNSGDRRSTRDVANQANTSSSREMPPLPKRSPARPSQQINLESGGLY